ncbi:MAG: hypothetical protein Q9164_007221 [Protoblastenia rupestris]
MSQPRPSLKLKFGSQASKPPEPPNVPASATSASTPKIKLKFGGPKSASAQDGPPTAASSDLKPPPKPARKSKPTPKKRAAEEAGDSDSEPLIDAPRPKKLKLTARTPSSAGAPLLKIKTKGKPPPRPLGVGYDSEASDREDDPTITDNFILRMTPGDDCDYLRKAVAERNFGPVKQGGADVRMRFLTKDARRAVIVIRGRMYAAILVDLPCILEAMKSWEKKSWWKSGDVCQMLLVLGRCKNEDEAVKYPLPTKKGELNEKTWQWAHGITPPMRWVRRRRFRKRISVKAVEEDEAEVERLLQADEECVPGTSRYRMFESVDDYDREQSPMQDEEGDEDAEGEIDDQVALTGVGGGIPVGEEEDDDDAFAAEMERAMAEHADETAAASAQPSAPIDTFSAHADAFTPTSEPPTPAIEKIATTDSPLPATSSGASDDEDEESEESDEDAPAVDEDMLERQQELQRQREEIADLEAAIAREKEGLARTTNAILRSKIVRRIESLEGDLEVRRRALGDDGEAEE